MKRLAVLLIVLAIILGVGGGVWYLLSQNHKAISSTSDLKGYKTYVSKYGFSVSYPADWILEEEKNPKGREYGHWPFGIYCLDKSGIGIDFTFNDSVTSDIDKSLIPSDPTKKILFLAKRNNIYNIDRNDRTEKIQINGINMLLVYYDGTRLRIAMFYIPEKDVIVHIFNESDSVGKDYFISILKTIRIVSAK